MANAFEVLQDKFPNEGRKVYKKLNYQMLYDEAEILLSLLDGTYNEQTATDYEQRCAINFKKYLGIN